MAVSYSGGDLQFVTINHPDLGTLNFEPYAGEDWTVDPGGYVSNDADEMIGAQGGFIDSQSLQRDSISCTLAAATGDGVIESLKALQKSTVLGVCTFTGINGNTYRINAKPVGRIMNTGKDSKIVIKFAGNGLKPVA
jgi:hypothetical protein